jgi:arylsulfatase A-like enzyme
MVIPALLLALAVVTSAQSSRPRLIVVVSFDQFRGDYPTRFAGAFPTSGGFLRIMAEGAVYSSCRYEHANNITGPGHATLLSGSYPSRTGIVGNDFCDLASGRCGYCAEDSAGTYGASKLLMPTLGDRLRSRNPKSKVVGIAIKDRAAILMAGRSATTCLWYEAAGRRWTSSAAYPQPLWLNQLNANNNIDKYIGAVWDPIAPSARLDSVDGEGAFPGGSNAFPHRILDPSHPKFVSSVLISPFSMEMLFDATRMVIDRERLGRDDDPDVLCVGVSTTDYAGHVFGPDSREIEDMYARADRHMERLLGHLDAKIGRKNYILVVSSDHGVAPIPEVIRRQAEQQRATIDAGRIREAEIQRLIDSALTATFGAPDDVAQTYVREIFEPSIYLNWKVIPERNRQQAIDAAVRAVRSHPGIGMAIASDSITAGQRPQGIDDQTWTYIRNSTYAGRTGEVVMYPKPYWIIGGNAATHGTPYDYDRWVPLMWYGAGIEPESSDRPCAPADIAPTLASLLGIELTGVDGQVLPLKFRQPLRKRALKR